MKVFTSKKKLLQQYVLGYQIDFYFPKLKLAIQVDEKGHIDRKKKKKKWKDKKQQKNNLIVNLLELTVMENILIFILKLAKYHIN